MALHSDQCLIVKYAEIVFSKPEIKLGSGAYGRVLQAKFRNNQVAIKLLHTRYEKDFIKKEAEILKKYKHKNIVTFYGAFYDIHENGIILELMEGGSLNDLLHKYTHVQYSYCHVANWLQQALDALEFLHKENVIHRDLKPLNMLLSNDFLTLKLSDFGTVRKIDNSMSSFRGTMVYMAPEVATKKYDSRCDIYSFGTILWELLTRTLPRVNKNGLLDQMKNHPQKIQELIKSCWSDNKNKRPTIEKIKLRVKTLCCVNCLNLCVPLTDTIVKEQAFSRQLTEQVNDSNFPVQSTEIFYLPPQNEIHNDEYNLALFHQACYSGNFKAVELLLNKCINAVDKDGVTSLRIACENGHFKVAKLLVEKIVDVNVTDKNGWTFLHYSCHHNQFKLAEFLLNKGANLNAVNKDGGTSLHIACENGHFEVAKLLVERIVNAKGLKRDGSTLCHSACHYNKFKSAEFLLNKGANLNVVNKHGKTPFDIAYQKNYFEIAELLLKTFIDVKGLKRDGWTPLHLTCHKGHVKIVEFLLKNGANVNAVTKDGETALCYACKSGYLKIVKLLLENGANVNIKDNEGMVPWDWVVEHGDESKFSKLKQKLKPDSK